MSLFRPAPKGALPVPIFRIGSKKYGKFHFVPFDEAPIFVSTHYIKGSRTEPCRKPNGEHCIWCDSADHEPAPIRERAYIGGLHAERKLSGVLELTERAGVELAELAKSASLIGMVIKCDRTTDKANSPIKLEPTGQTGNVHKYLAGWNTIVNLCATWGIDVPGQAKLAEHTRPEGQGRDGEAVPA